MIDINVSTNTNTTTEAGGLATISINLQKKPTSNVILTFSSSNTNEGTLSKNTITFTTANWKTVQTLNVIGVDDLIEDGNTAFTFSFDPANSSDLAYQGMDPADILFTNQDNDTANVVITGAN